MTKDALLRQLADELRKQTTQTIPVAGFTLVRCTECGAYLASDPCTFACPVGQLLDQVAAITTEPAA